MAFGRVEFVEKWMGAQSLQHAAGFADSNADFGFISESRFESEGTQEVIECVVGEMPAVDGFVDASPHQPGGSARTFGLRGNTPDALGRVRLAGRV